MRYVVIYLLYSVHKLALSCSCHSDGIIEELCPTPVSQSRSTMLGYGSSVATRGLIHANSARAKADCQTSVGFKPLHKPHWLLVNKKVKAIKGLTVDDGARLAFLPHHSLTVSLSLRGLCDV